MSGKRGFRWRRRQGGGASARRSRGYGGPLSLAAPSCARARNRRHAPCQQPRRRPLEGRGRARGERGRGGGEPVLSLLCSLLVLLLHPSLSSAEPPTAAAVARPGQPETGGDAASVRRIARFRSRGTCQGTRVEARGRESNRRGQRLLSRLSPLLLSAPSLALAARAPCPRALPRAILTTDARYCSERARAPSRGLRGVKGRSPRLLFALLTLSCECFVGTFGLLSLWGPGIGRARCSEEAGGGSCWCDKRWVDVRLVCLCVRRSKEG